MIQNDFFLPLSEAGENGNGNKITLYRKGVRIWTALNSEKE